MKQTKKLIRAVFISGQVICASMDPAPRCTRSGRPIHNYTAKWDEGWNEAAWVMTKRHIRWKYGNGSMWRWTHMTFRNGGKASYVGYKAQNDLMRWDECVYEHFWGEKD